MWILLSLLLLLQYSGFQQTADRCVVCGHLITEQVCYSVALLCLFLWKHLVYCLAYYYYCLILSRTHGIKLSSLYHHSPCLGSGSSVFKSKPSLRSSPGLMTSIFISFNWNFWLTLVGLVDNGFGWVNRNAYDFVSVCVYYSVDAY